MNTTEIKSIVTTTLAEFSADAEKEIIDTPTNADTGRGVSRTELDNVPAVFVELARLEDTTPYGLGNRFNWKLSGYAAAFEIACRRVWDGCPEIEFEEARELAEAALSSN